MNSMLQKCDFSKDEYGSSSDYYSDYSDYSDYEDNTMNAIAVIINNQIEQEMYDNVSLDG